VQGQGQRHPRDTDDDAIGGRDLVRAIVGFAIYLLLVPGALFVAAGTVRWPAAWVYVGLLLLSTLGSRLLVFLRDPSTLRERARFSSAPNTKPWERLLVPIVGLLGPLTIATTAGLQRRLGGPAGLPGLVQALAALLVAAGYGLAVWAMVANRYFSAVARIQEERGHRVVSDGPYRLVRHPSYAGALLAGLAVPLMLDAPWALLPALLTGAAIVVRTALEDRMLREELEGYQDYAERTGARLMPGIW
jgi:protein-S-isoprenylcysteine O-methyltransferase Ste14